MKDILTNLNNYNLEKIIWFNKETIQQKLCENNHIIVIKPEELHGQTTKNMIIQKLVRHIGKTNWVTWENVENALNTLWIQRPTEFKYWDNEIPYNQGKNKIRIWIDHNKTANLLQKCYRENQVSQAQNEKGDTIGDKLKEVVDIIINTKINEIAPKNKKTFQNVKDFKVLIEFAKYIYTNDIRWVRNWSITISYRKDQKGKENFSIRNRDNKTKALFYKEWQEVVLKEIPNNNEK